MKIFYINLKKRTDRKEHMEKMCWQLMHCIQLCVLNVYYQRMGIRVGEFGTDIPKIELKPN